MSVRRSGPGIRLAALLLLLPSLVVAENRSKFNAKLAPGDPAPRFEKLPGADGETHGLADYKEAKVVVVCFASTLCGVVDLYEPRLAEFAAKYKKQGVQVVAISCERRGPSTEIPGGAGEVTTPEKSGELARIRERVKEHQLPFDYLYDGSQATGRAYGALATPTLFVLDGKRRIVYLGPFDDSIPVDGVERHYVRDAVEAVLAGKSPQKTEALARGCRIDYAETSKPADSGKDSP